MTNENNHTHCACGSKLNVEQIFDGRGIFLMFACSKCRKQKLQSYRPDILEHYRTDEQIENDY